MARQWILRQGEPDAEHWAGVKKHHRDTGTKTMHLTSFLASVSAACMHAHAHIAGMQPNLQQPSMLSDLLNVLVAETG